MADVSPYAELVNALNRLHYETDAEVLSIKFSKPDVPIDWNEYEGEWVETYG